MIVKVYERQCVLVAVKNKKLIFSKFVKSKNCRKVTAAVCSAAILATVFPSFGMYSSASETIYAKTTDALNLRTGPGVEYSVSGVMADNTTVTILEAANSRWVKVKLSDGKTGYCSANYIDVTADAKTTEYVNIRSGAGTDSSVIKTVDEGTKLDVITFSGPSWAKVSLADGTTGYINTDYIEYITGSSSSASVTPEKPADVPKGKITLSTTGRSLAVGNIFVLTASGNKNKVQWYTSDSNVAVVSTSGVVSGISPGEVIIHAVDTSIGATATCKVTVVKTDYYSINLSDLTKQINEGKSFTLKATSNPSGGDIFFESEDTSIAKVSSKGKVTGVGEGTVWITARDSTGVITRSCRVTVKGNAKVSLSQSSATVATGRSIKLNASVSPSNTPLTWTSSNLSVAGVNNGVVSGISAGTAVITVKDTATGKARATCKVTVTASSKGNVKLSRYSTSTTAGKTIYIKGYNGAKWETSDSNIATVSDGFIKTKKAGSVAISYVDYYGNRAVCAVKVADAAPIKFSYSSPNSATINSNVDLIAITDKTRSDVYFMVNVDGTDIKVKASRKTSDGNTYIWKGTYKTTKAGTFKVKAYSYKDGFWSTCTDGTSDVYVTDKTHSSTTALTPLRASDEVIKYIGLKEGFVPSAVYDPLVTSQLLPTLGHGYVVWEGDCFYNDLTKNEAYALLVRAVNEEVYSKRVNEMLIDNNIRFNQQQFDSLVSFSYNLGTGWTYSSDLKNILLNSYGTVTTAGTTLTGTVISDDGLNLRSDATTNSSVIEVLDYNEKVTLLSAQKYNNVWYKVRTSSGKTGYCSGTYLNVTSSSSKTGRDLNYVNRNALIREMLSYHHAGGVCYYGLLYRRADELEMFLYNEYIADGRDNNHNFPDPSCISFP